MTGIEDLRWAWWAHRQVPYRFQEIWTKKGRDAHYRRLVTYLSTRMAEEVRRDLMNRGLRAPANWTDTDLAELHEVLVGRCYEVAGFLPEEDGLTVDVGCGFGDFSLLAARRCDVLSFDPNPENTRRTGELLGANRLEGRVSVETVALGGRNGVISLGRSGDAMVSRASVREAREHPLRTLDSLPLDRRVDLLKIDVEGMEADVLVGANSMLRKDRPRIIVEVHGRGPAKAVREILMGLGYTLAWSGPKRHGWQFGPVSNEFWKAEKGAS
ncbi:MAG: FkbM family methyltransferase [Thermoplasmata archaeon]